VWEEVTRAALEEGLALRVPMPEETARVPAQVEATAADALSRAIGSYANEAEPWPQDVLSRGDSAPGTSRAPGSIPPRDAASLLVLRNCGFRGPMSWGCRATLEHRPCLPAKGRWREAQS
jgi:hypothetical protein